MLRGYDVSSPSVSIDTTRISLDRLFMERLANVFRLLLQVFLNIVLDEAVEEKAGGEKVRIGMVVIRGNSVVMLEVTPPLPRIYIHSRRLADRSSFL